MQHDENDNSSTDSWFSDEAHPLIAKPGELTPAPWRCAACGQANETLVDLSAGYHQEYVEDCAVCCRPNLMTMHIDPTSLIVSLRNELEYE